MLSDATDQDDDHKLPDEVMRLMRDLMKAKVLATAKAPDAPKPGPKPREHTVVLEDGTHIVFESPPRQKTGVLSHGGDKSPEERTSGSLNRNPDDARKVSTPDGKNIKTEENDADVAIAPPPPSVARTACYSILNTSATASVDEADTEDNDEGPDLFLDPFDTGTRPPAGGPDEEEEHCPW